MQQQYHKVYKYNLSKGQTTFSMRNPKIDLPSLRYNITFASIYPDYFSKTAIENNLESDMELAEIAGLDFEMNFSYNDTFLVKGGPKSEVIVGGPSMTMSLENIRAKIHSLSLDNYSESFIQQPFVIDYFYSEKEPESDMYYSQVMDISDYQYICNNIANLKIFTENLHDTTKHNIGVPLKLQQNKLDAVRRELTNVFVNPLIFPTNSTFDWEKIRVRFTIAPFICVGFSNKHVLHMFGFDDDWIKQYCFFQNNQYWIISSYVVSETFVAPKKPVGIVNFAKQCKIYLRQGNSRDRSRISKTFPKTNLNLTLANLKDRKLVAQTFTKMVSDRLYNFNVQGFKAEFVKNANDKSKFVFEFPDVSKFTLWFKLSYQAMEVFNFDSQVNTSSIINVSNCHTNGFIDTNMYSIDTVQNYARLLVMSTSVIVIVLTNALALDGSMTEAIMCEAVGDGTMKNPYQGPVINLSSLDKHLNFQLMQFSENGTILPLNWPRGLSVICVLEGRL